jgi:hypothetical protein
VFENFTISYAVEDTSLNKKEIEREIIDLHEGDVTVDAISKNIFKIVITRINQK